jgi:hypothetical protein
MYWLSVLSILTALSPGLAIPSASESIWDDFRVKHAWATLPKKWNWLNYPPANTTIDLRIALKSCDDGALIDELYQISDPNNPKYVYIHVLSPSSTSSIILPADTARIYQRRKLLSWSHHIHTLSSSSSPGSTTTGSIPPLSRPHTVATG